MRILRWISNIWMVVLILNLLLAATLVGGRAVLPMFATPALLRAAEPADGSQQVPVRARAVLHFDRPMNPRSVEAAFQLEPETPSLLIWDANFTTLTISPTLSLRPATDYRLTIGTTALERNLRPVAAPLRVAFRTVAAPAVRSTIPAEGSTEVLPVAPIVINFSRPMVPPTSVLSITSFPALRFEPPIVGSTRWLDQSTLLFQIDTPLAPATEYRATIAGDLADLGGGPLGESYSWSFRVAAPNVLATSPNDSARDVGLRVPLTITLTQALPSAQLRQALQLSPRVDGQVQARVLPDLTQIVTFTPSVGWQPATQYEATLQLSSDVQASWSFRTAPRLALTGRFPGEAQILPLNQPLRLIFSTAVDPELLRTALRFNPPVEQLQISGSGSELQITAALRAATAYTVTIAPDLTDRNGTTLGITAMMRFQTAPAAPILTLPEVTGRLAQFLPDQPIELLVRRTNLSALSLELFDMDEATVVRTRVFSDSDWQRFEPERYQRPLRHSWNVPLNDTLNGAVEDRLAIRDANDAALPLGLYYLRIRSPEGPRADLIFAITTTQLTMQIGASGSLIWATDAFSGTVLPNIPLVLYQDDVLILESTTDSAGILRFNLAGGLPHTYTVLARSPNAALSSIGPLTLPINTARQNYRLTALSNGQRFTAGTTLLAAGFVREVLTNTLQLPSTNLTVQIQLRDSSDRVQASSQVPTDATGSYAATLELRSDLPAGQYRLVTSVAGSSDQQPILIEPDRFSQNVLRIDLQRPNEAEISALVTAITDRGLPLASIPVTWTLHAVLGDLPLPGGYTLGVAGATLPATLSGNATTDSSGKLTLPISPTLTSTNQPVRYQLRLIAAGTEANASFTINPGSVYIGVQAEQLIAANRGAWILNLRVIDAIGTPVARQAMQVQLLTADQPTERTVTTRRVISATDGSVRLELPATTSGAFVIRVTTTDSQGRVSTTELPVWAAGTPLIAPATAQLVADRANYLPGEVATLLPILPTPGTTSLVLITRGSVLESGVRSIQSGLPFTITLATSASSDTRVSLLTPIISGIPGQRASVVLPLTQSNAAQLKLVSDKSSYAPGAMATITATTSVTATNLMIGLFRDPPDSSTRPAFYWSGPISTSNGSIILNVPLPQTTGPVYARVWDANSQANLMLTVAQSLAVYLDAPAFVRSGDRFELPARIINSSSVTSTVTLELRSDQFVPQSTSPLSQTIDVAPASSVRVVFDGSTNTSQRITLSLQASADGEVAVSQAEIAVLTDTTAIAADGALVTSQYSSLIPGHPQGTLSIDIAGSPQAIALAAVRSMVALPIRTNRDEAALLLSSAPFAETRTVAITAITRLAQTQNSDGGWGWWPTLRSDPTVTAAVLEAFAAANTAQLRVPDRSRTNGITWAERNLDAPIITKQRLQLAYALALHQRTPIALLNEFSDRAETLSAQEAALLLLALPSNQEQARSVVLQRLVLLVERENGIALWPDETDLTKRSVEVTALALQALQQANAQPALQSEALAALARWRSPYGWGDPNSTARAIAAVRAAWLVTQSSLQYTLNLNSTRLLAQAGGALTTTQQLQIPANQLSSTNMLTVTTTAGPLFLSYQLDAPGTPAADADAILILRELIDPQTGAILATTQLPNQPVMVRLTMIVQRQLGYSQLEVGLPPGATIQRLADSLPWPLVAHTGDHLLFVQDATIPGVYEVRYLLQPGLRGQFQVPAPLVRDQYGRVISVEAVKR